MTDVGFYVERVTSGQQKGSKRLKSSLRNRAQISPEGSQTRMNRAIARQSSLIVVSVERACHTGGRGFESRRSRFCSSHLLDSFAARDSRGKARGKKKPATLRAATERRSREPSARHARRSGRSRAFAGS
jgi:hypothetical protein